MKKINNINFKKAMGKFATGVTVISINHKNLFLGKTVNSFTSLSLNPPLILFSLDKKSSSLSKFKRSEMIGINVLSYRQKKLSKYYAEKNNVWGSAKFFLSKKNIPLLEDSVVNLVCKKIKNISAGDHIIFICKIIELYYKDASRPLIYVNNKYI